MTSPLQKVKQLLRLSRHTTCLFVHVPNENIAHFFHEQLQYLWIYLSTVKSQDIVVHVDSKQPWIQAISKTITEGLGFKYLDYKPSLRKVKIVDVLIGKARIFSLEELPMIRNTIYYKFGIEAAQPDLKILYTRKDAFRRRILNSSAIADLFDLVVDDLEIPFSQQVYLFSRASHFVAPEGAHMTNLVLMNPAASVLSLQVNRKNSWPEMFGTDSLVRKFDTRVTIASGLQHPNKATPLQLGTMKQRSQNVGSVRDTGELDMDIVADGSLREIVSSFLNEQ